MKASDIATVTLVGIIGIAVSIWLCNILLGNPDNEVVTFRVVESLDGTIAMPNPDIFNVNAINPTVEVYVGSCEDLDRDGKINEYEYVACNEIKSE